MEPILSMKNITKTFYGNFANKNVSFDVYKGEIHALVGENGAGKTTLMSILYGLYPADEGDIYIRGNKIDISEPSVAIRNGIGMVFQHFMLVEPFTVAENIILGKEPKKGLFVDNKKAVEDVKKISQQYGLKVDPNAKIATISVGMQQRVEIIKTLYRGAEILILDEPTAVLTPQEVEEFFGILRLLKSQGKTIIIITHKLREVMEISDRVSILRKGELVGNVLTKDTDEHELATMMVGREISLEVDKKNISRGDVVLKIENLRASSKMGDEIEGLRGVTLEVHEGEVLGIAGVDGNGQTELLEVLTGLREAASGVIRLKGEDITNLSSRKIREKGIANIPEDRHQRGVLLKNTLAENLILGDHYKAPFNRCGFLNRKAIHKNAKKCIEEYDIRPAKDNVKVRALSGGNQQKVIIAREFGADPELLIASQPTRGVDIGAIEFIHKKIIERRNNGKAVLLISADLQEIMSLSDRIAVIYEGEIVKVLNAKGATENELGLLMAGIKRSSSSTEEEN
ncbi:MAG: ABC transporter ATP-binding protein [Clostridiales bacterium]|nr:ABC transporter ATP-binding protein [Clostridiales bacterium]